MSLVKRTQLPARGPMRDFDDLRQRVFRLFEDPFSLPMLQEAVGWTPDVDISEANGHIEVKAELPGMKKEDVEIEIEGNVLTLRGEKKEEKEEKDRERYLYECSYGSFQRSFTLPSAVREDQVKADFNDGVLKITLPKTGEPRGKKIPIA